MEKKCSIGFVSTDGCQNKANSSQEIDFIDLSNLSETDIELLKLRSNCENIDSICSYHQSLYLGTFENRQRICCDPFKKHGKQSIKKSLKPVSLTMSKKYKALKLIPGTKLCITCRKAILTPMLHNFPDECMSENEFEDPEYVPGPSRTLEKLNESCELLDLSPFKVTKRKLDRRPEYIRTKSRKLALKFQETASEVLHVSMENVSEPSGSNECIDCNILMQKLKEKFSTSCIKEKLQILTLVPASWSIEKTRTFFNTTEYMVKKSRKLLKEDGILSKGSNKVGNRISKEVEARVQTFYYDDDISRVSANKKDCLSIPSEEGKRVYKSKRLILHNLKDVYLAFKEKHPSDKIGLTKFCELRPKECVTVNNRGMHNVCVCIYHQNVKLMMHAVNLKESYIDLLQKLVCNIENEECMLHRCSQCPQENELRNYLLELEYLQDAENVIFKQWVQTDRSSLDTLIKSVDEFVESLVQKLQNLTQHHYISKSQSCHLKASKETLAETSCIIIVDFAENYTCLLQDAAQGFHWQNIQVTLHPFVVYYKTEDCINTISMCCISDCLKHDTNTFYAFQKTALAYVQGKLPHIEHVIYFSDGSSAQYKNFKNFVNLCYHKQDYGLTAEWNFFATSHGKNVCDGIGGTIKRLATRASLQRSYDNHILSAKDLFTFAKVHVAKKIYTYYIMAEEVIKFTEMLEKRYENISTIPGTRINHFFQPLDESRLLIKRVSSSNKSFQISLGLQKKEITIKEEKFVAVIYDNQWWLGKILEVSEVHRDAKIKFMRPSGPSSSYSWPNHTDVCWIPYENILMNVPAPCTSTSTGRLYTFDSDIILSIQKMFKNN